jgi:hypothetical protein
LRINFNSTKLNLLFLRIIPSKSGSIVLQDKIKKWKSYWWQMSTDSSANKRSPSLWPCKLNKKDKFAYQFLFFSLKMISKYESYIGDFS